MPSGFPKVGHVILACLFLSSPLTAQVRDRAVLDLSFDDLAEAPSATADGGKAGKVADVVSLSSGGTRIASPFKPGNAGYSLMLDSARQQHLVIGNSDDVSRADAVTISGFFASLHPLNDAAYHGLFAKRRPGGGDVSNYGINFQPSSDNFQIYINDGSGYKVANYSVKTVLGYRRRVHLAVCLDMADAPGADADTDPDDVRVRLLVNGTPVAPLRASGGFVEGNTGWLQDVSLAKCVSDTPLTIGASFATGEFSKLICDDFQIFAASLTDEEARTLFTEVAGDFAAEITAEQTSASSGTAVPQIVSLTPHSAEVGKTTRISIAGRDLADARVHSDVKGLTFTVADGSKPGQLNCDVAVDATVVPGRYLVRCVTPSGVSNPAIITVDKVPTHPDGTFTEASPATVFPVSVSGRISGAEQKRLWFRGTAGQKIMAEVEARRIGSKLDPVVEIRTQSGTPLAIQWQQPELSGDSRTSVVLPADGLYFAEVHDLQYRSPGGSSWRVIIGDLPPASLAYPATLTAAGTSVRTVGQDAVSEAVTVKAFPGQLAADSGSPVLPLPALRTDAGVAIVEPVEGTFAETPLDATFTVSPFPALLVSGRIAAPKEQDTVTLTVTPGQTLHFAVAARQLSSPLRAHLTVLNGDAIVAASDGESGASDPSVTYAVPEKVTQLKVRIRDLNQKGSAAAVYRLLVARSDRQAFVLSTPDGAVRLPFNGSVPLRLSVVRQSPSFRYTGPIRLFAEDEAGITVVPNLIPASEQDQQVLVMLTRSASVQASDVAAGQSVRIQGKAEGADPVFATTVSIELAADGSQSLTLPETTVLAGPAESIPATIVPESAPPVLFRGLPSVISLRVIPLTDQMAPFVRFDMLTTEVPRREDPNKPDSPLKPMVGLEEFQFGPVSQTVFPLTVRVPLDTPASVIDAVISADFVTQPLASGSGSQAWTAPLILSVDDAVTLQAGTEPLRVQKAKMVALSGTIRRHPLFGEAVDVVMEGLPQGYSVAPVTLPSDQSEFTLMIAVPEAAAVGDVPNLSVRVRNTNGLPISKPAAVKLTVESP